MRLFSTPAFWEGNSTWSRSRRPEAIHARNASLTPALQAGDVFGFPGATPAISSNGAANGIVWVIGYGNTALPMARAAADRRFSTPTMQQT